MPGFTPTQQALNVRNGNAVAIVLGDQVIAFAQTTGHQISMGGEQLYGIGTQKPQEVQQLRMSPAFSLDTFDLTSDGITLLQGGQNLNYLLAGQQYVMHVLDNNNTVIFTYVGAKCQNFSQSIPANAPIRDTYSFLAIDVLDPDGNSIMDDKNNAIQVNTSGASQTSITNALGLNG